MEWTPEEVALLRELCFKASFTFVRMSEEFTAKVLAKAPGFTVERSEDAVRAKAQRLGLVAKAHGTPTMTQRMGRMLDLAKQYRMDSLEVTVGIVPNVKRKILSLSDLHFPFVKVGVLESILVEHEDADVVVVNGDMLDGYIFSAFKKEARVAALHEYQMALDFIKHLSLQFPLVVLVSGNHDGRPAKSLQYKDYDDEASQIFRPDLIARLANGEVINEQGEVTDILHFKNVKYQHSESWYVRIGKTIFAHPSGYNGGYPGATVDKTEQQFAQRYGAGDYDAVVIGHTHKIYKGVVRGKLLIEQGALCARLGYQQRSDLRFPNAMNGYAVVYQDENGNTCFNRSGPVYLGTEVAPKKSIL